ncbi:YidH family protein [Novosphingobium lindaniclasticum]|uniref:DUF202 domain-containing protein n=1 Tax=Novosphingobium lindaniclasticum LE124 TaxID=1096930 RepID=T0HK31_9SPHN|nr:DUF202 domain-containing protein [Novosphingobium lindaniclasticum]EQB12538.1 hypothetical protein L284_15525 [Novosphingobium lindaniclasticum LE124]
MTEEIENARDAQVSLAETAGTMRKSADAQTDSADRRTELAADRTVLAAERTYAAWVRTGLSALAAGIGAHALLENKVPSWLVAPTGSLLVLFSAFCFGAAVWREMLKVAPPRPHAVRIPPVLLVAVNGFLIIVSLAALLEIWVV